MNLPVQVLAEPLRPEGRETPAVQGGGRERNDTQQDNRTEEQLRSVKQPRAKQGAGLAI